MAVLEELTQSVQGVAAKVGPAVVGLGRGFGRGSGVVVGPGRVVTNAHNIRSIVIIALSFPSLTVARRRFNADVGVASPCRLLP